MLNWINLRKNGQVTPTEINNKILAAPKAMPLKNITSDNTGDFELGRASFAKSYFPPLKADYVKNVQKSLAPLVPEQPTNYNLWAGNFNDMSSPIGPKNVVIKKWTANRDASDITRNRRVNSIGNGSLNANGKPMAFNTSHDNNTERQAIVRARAGGASTPKKVTHKYMYTAKVVPSVM